MGKQRARKPTRKQKELLSKKGLVPGNWFVEKETDGLLQVVNKTTKNRRALKLN